MILSYLLTGGIDSSLLANMLKQEDKKVSCLYFDLNNYRVEKEIHFAKKASFKIGYPLEIINFNGFMDLMDIHLQN